MENDAYTNHIEQTESTVITSAQIEIADGNHVNRQLSPVRKPSSIAHVASEMSDALQSQRMKVTRRIKDWQKSVLLFVILLIYLAFGAFVFRALELAFHRKTQDNLFRLTEEFLANNTCLEKSALLVYTRELIDALNEGALPLKSAGRSDVKADNALDDLWTLPNAFFFACTVVTTIGYGNIAPRTRIGKYVCIVYALIGIPITGWMLSSIGKTFQSNWFKFKKFVKRLTKKISPSDSTHGIIHGLITFFILYSALIGIPAAVISWAEGWTYINAQYFCFISLSTIGFGDLSPGSWTDHNVPQQWLQTVAYVCYLLIGLSVISVALTAFFRKNEAKFKRAGARVRKFVTDSARSATVRMKEVEYSLKSRESPIASVKQFKLNLSREGSTSSQATVSGLDEYHKNVKTIDTRL